MESNSTAFLIKIKLRHSLGRPSRSDFVQSGLVGDSMKKKTKIIIGILVVFAILVAGISYREYIKAHTFTLSGNEQIQSITGTVKVSSPKDTEVIFIDVKTGVNYAIPYITSGASETIKLEKGKWYSVETGEGLTMSLVNVRIE